MEAEFVNIFVEKQREAITDLTSRNIMLEARIAFAEQKMQLIQDYEQRILELQNSNQDRTKEVGDVKQLLTQSVNDIAKLENIVIERDKELVHLRTKVSEMQTDGNQLRETLKKMQTENEIQQARAARLKSKAKQLAEE